MNGPVEATEAGFETPCTPGPTGLPAEAPPGPGWWIASDGNWYPPTLYPDQLSPAPPPAVPPAAATTWWRTYWFSVTGAVAVLAVLSIFIIASATGSGGNSYYTRPVASDHQDQLATGESQLIANRAVTVDGYFYLDAAGLETTNLLGWADYWQYGAASMHVVIAEDVSQNTTQGEVGLLVFVESDRTVRRRNGPQLAAGSMSFYNDMNGNSVSGSPAREFDIEAIRVYLFEDSTMPNSRFVFTWLYDGVRGFIDGSRVPEIERWLRAYLPLVQPGGN